MIDEFKERAERAERERDEQDRAAQQIMEALGRCSTAHAELTAECDALRAEVERLREAMLWIKEKDSALIVPHGFGDWVRVFPDIARKRLSIHQLRQIYESAHAAGLAQGRREERELCIELVKEGAVANTVAAAIRARSEG